MFHLGSISWQARGPNSGLTLTAGIGFQQGYFTAGFAFSYNFSHDHDIQVGLYAGVQGSGFSLGLNYNLNHGYLSGWSSLSIGTYLPQINTASQAKGWRPMSIINWALGIQSVTGIEDPNQCKDWLGEEHWLTAALDKLALHPVAVVHDNWVEARGLRPGIEFVGIMFPSAFAGRSIAGPNTLNPYGYRNTPSGYVW